jgi:hypothetical protein
VVAEITNGEIVDIERRDVAVRATVDEIKNVLANALIGIIGLADCESDSATRK